MKIPSIRSLRVFAMTGGLALGVALVVGIAGASIPQDGVITGCYMKSGGTLRVIDASVTKCKSSETMLTWSQGGQPGFIGALAQTDVYQTSETDEPLHMTTLGQWYTLVSIHKPAGGWWDSAAVTASINIGNGTLNTTAINCFIAGAGAPLITVLQTVGPQTLNFTVPYSDTGSDVELECRLPPTNDQPSLGPYDVVVGWATVAVVPASYANTVAH